MHCKETSLAAFRIENFTVRNSFVYLIHLHNKLFLDMYQENSI